MFTAFLQQTSIAGIMIGSCFGIFRLVSIEKKSLGQPCYSIHIIKTVVRKNVLGYATRNEMIIDSGHVAPQIILNIAGEGLTATCLYCIVQSSSEITNTYTVLLFDSYQCWIWFLEIRRYCFRLILPVL